MQIVSIGDNLHEMSNPVFWEKWEKYHQFAFCWIIQESGELSKRVVMVNMTWILQNKTDFLRWRPDDLKPIYKLLSKKIW